jgi:hypothetical protein
MPTIFERVETALTTITPPTPFALAPYIGSPLPDVYVVHQLITSPSELHADDEEEERSYLVQISIYSKTGLAALPDVDTAMLAAGFFKDDQRQLPKDPDSGHFGLAKDYVYFETKE